MIGTANSGEVKYYNFPFHSSGITFRLDVFQGSIIAYASYTTDAPNTQRGYNWTLQTAIYDDLFFSPAPGSTVYVALQGTQSSNSFRVGVVMQEFTTTGKTSNAVSSFILHTNISIISLKYISPPLLYGTCNSGLSYSLNSKIQITAPHEVN